MGVVSRRVVPACGNICFFCPSLRARSRQPVKRYKKLLRELFQDAEPNDRKIAKLCEYASKNPLRIPEITTQLEQRCYKDLRRGKFGSVRVVLCIYRKLLSSCKDQMPLFGSSLLGIIRTLLEQTGHDEIQILGSNALVDFIKIQMDGTYMFNLEGLVPTLCQLAQEMGDDERALCLRSAGMEAVAVMVRFMGEHSHISMDFDTIISVTLENYMDYQKNAKEEGRGTDDPDMDQIMDISKNPSYWSRICLQNMARLAKEATTVRRVLEPLFHKFDAEDYWSPEKGVAYSVLMYLHTLLKESGENSHLLFSILVKHLDHKNVAKQPLLQIDIVHVTTKLAENAKQHSSVAILGAITELMKHLRKCLLNSAETSISRDGCDKWNIDLQFALEKCISELAKKVADAGPILDMMAVVLENLPITTVVARSTISAVHRTAQIISSIPNVSYNKKAFPDALFHQLLLAMGHPDNETRIGAHTVFAIVIMPSVLSRAENNKNTQQAVSRQFSVDTLQKMRSGSFSIQEEGIYQAEVINGGLSEESSEVLDVAKRYMEVQPHDHLHSFKHALTDGKTAFNSLRLSSHQVSLLLSSIWVQATSAENTPANFVATAHTYNIALLFTRPKTSSHVALVRCFQLAFSLRSISLDQEGGLHPSRRRSLFMLASSMLIFCARAGNLPELVPMIKASLTDKVVDPYLKLVEDIRLQAVCLLDREEVYGSQDDGISALKSLSEIKLNGQHLKETVMSHLVIKLGKLSEDELSNIKQQLLEEFSPDDAYPLGASLSMETPWPCSPLAQMELQPLGEDMVSDAFSDDESFPEPSGSVSDRKTSLSINSLDILSVNELLESVLETARQVASFPVSSTCIPYDQMKNQCEALVTGKQRKMSVLHSFKTQQDVKAIVSSSEIEKADLFLPDTNMDFLDSELETNPVNEDRVQAREQLLLCSHEYGQRAFRLPPSSPYDKFMKAAGC